MTVVVQGFHTLSFKAKYLTDEGLRDTADPSLSSALRPKQANQSVASASSDQDLSNTRLCSIETH